MYHNGSIRKFQVIALLMGLMYYKTGYDQQRVQNIPAALFFAVIQLSISTMIAVLQVILNYIFSVFLDLIILDVSGGNACVLARTSIPTLSTACLLFGQINS